MDPCIHLFEGGFPFVGGGGDPAVRLNPGGQGYCPGDRGIICSLGSISFKVTRMILGLPARYGATGSIGSGSENPLESMLCQWLHYHTSQV